MAAIVKIRFANATAYLVTTKRGAIRSMPDRCAVLELLKQQGQKQSMVLCSTHQFSKYY